MSIEQKVNECLKAYAWGTFSVMHYFNSVELYDGFTVFDGDSLVTTFIVSHSQIENGEATPEKIARGIIDYIIKGTASGSLGDRVNISRYVLDDIKETLKRAATDIAILIGRELEDAKKAEENGVNSYLSLESFYRFDLEELNCVLNKIARY